MDLFLTLSSSLLTFVYIFLENALNLVHDVDTKTSLINKPV